MNFSSFFIRKSRNSMMFNNCNFNFFALQVFKQYQYFRSSMLGWLYETICICLSTNGWLHVDLWMKQSVKYRGQINKTIRINFADFNSRKKVEVITIASNLRFEVVLGFNIIFQIKLLLLVKNNS